MSDSELFATDFPLEAGFITMDGERHTEHRKVVQPVASPRNLKVLEPLIRSRAVEILQSLPERVRSNFVKGYSRLPVRVHPWCVTG